MRFTFEAMGVSFSGTTEDFDIHEVIEALELVSNLTITLPAMTSPALATAATEAFTEPELSDIEKVYGAGFVYENEGSNPSKGFRQPVPGDVYLDPDPNQNGDGAAPAPRRKTSYNTSGPRLILSYR